MADEVLVLAYDSALSALREQDATLNSLRNRATGLLAAVAVGTSVATGVGLQGSPGDGGTTLPTWAGWLMLLLVAGIGAGVLVVLWPTSRWSFGPDPARLLASSGDDVDRVRRVATAALIEAIAANDRTLTRRMHAYRVGAVLLMLETVVLLLALITG